WQTGTRRMADVERLLHVRDARRMRRAYVYAGRVRCRVFHPLRSREAHSGANGRVDRTGPYRHPDRGDTPKGARAETASTSHVSGTGAGSRNRANGRQLSRTPVLSPFGAGMMTVGTKSGAAIQKRQLLLRTQSAACGATWPVGTESAEN